MQKEPEAREQLVRILDAAGIIQTDPTIVSTAILRGARP